MMGEKISINEIAEIIMGQSPTGNTYNHIGDGLPLLNGPTEFGPYYPECTMFTTDSKRESKPGDLIFCVRGSTTGRMNWADQIYSLGRGVCSIRGENQLKTKYIKYSLDAYLDGLLQLAGGGTFPNLSKNDIGGFKIPHSDNDEEIASILSAYDDLIENNLKRIKLLEEKAFVSYKLLVNSEKLIEGRVGDLADVKSGFAFKSKDWTDIGYPVIKIKNIRSNDIDLTDCSFIPENVADDASKFKLNPGDLLIAMTGATVGKIGMMPKTETNFYLNQRVGIFRPKKENAELFLFCFFNEHSAKNSVESLASGAAQPNISGSQIEIIKLFYPKVQVVSEFGDSIKNHFELIWNLKQQNTKLRQARDILLPRLMSVEIET